MYKIILKNGSTSENLHELTAGSDRKAAACTFSEGINMIPTATIAIYPQNPVYNSIVEMSSTIEIVNTISSNVEFEGRVLKVSQGMDSKGIVLKQITCEGFMGYLYDTIQKYRHFTTCSTTYLLQEILIEHNNKLPVGSDKRIWLGSIDAFGNVPEADTDYEQTFKAIKRLLLDVYGGEMSLRRAQSGLVLDWLQTPTAPMQSTTTIELAKNIVSLNVDTDATHIITRLFPYGAKTTNQQGQQTGDRVTIETEQDGYLDPPDNNYLKTGTYIDDENAQAAYGIICGTVIFDDDETPSSIKDKGLAYMQANNRIKRGFKAEVLDLSTIGLDADSLKVGYAYPFKNSLIGLDEPLRLVKKTVDIYKPYQPTVEIGDKSQKITTAAGRAVNFIEYELPKVKTSIIDSAREQASALINNATKGYIYVDNDNGELLIMDAPDKANAQKVWRWNSGGFGYTPNYQNGQGTFTIAMTMDNTLVADFVMAAHIIAENLTVTGGKIDITSSSETNDRVSLSYHEWRADLAPLQLKLSNSSTNVELLLQAGGIFFKENGNQVFTMGSDGTVAIWNGSNWVTVDLKAISTLWSAVFGSSGVIQSNIIHANELWAIDPDLPSGSMRNIMTMLKDHEQRISALENA